MHTLAEQTKQQSANIKAKQTQSNSATPIS
jgi:hypothetical protein